MKIRTLYLDMDGVLANFEKRWIDLFETSPNETRSKKNLIQTGEDLLKTRIL